MAAVMDPVTKLDVLYAIGGLVVFLLCWFAFEWLEDHTHL